MTHDKSFDHKQAYQYGKRKAHKVKKKKKGKNKNEELLCSLVSIVATLFNIMKVIKNWAANLQNEKIKVMPLCEEQTKI